MGLFNRKKPVPQEEVLLIKEAQKTVKDFSIAQGGRTLKDFISPSFIGRKEEGHLQVNDKYVRSYVLEGYPNTVSVGWLDTLFNHEGEMDTTIHIFPANERKALEDITHKITQLEAQFINEKQRGNITNITRLEHNISELYAQRERLEQNYENLFHVQIACTLHTDSLDELKKEHEKLDNKLKGRKVMLQPVYLEQDLAYKTALPLGKSYLPEMFRNANTGVLTACFPFYNNEISHENGVFCGVNLSTSTPVLIDFYDRRKLNNSNVNVFGASGSGKTFFVSLLTLRSIFKKIHTVIIDAEGEYVNLTREVGGTVIHLAPGSEYMINPFDLEEEERKDGTKVVNIKSKVSDVLNLIGVMVGGLPLSTQSILAETIMNLYASFGLTEDVDSLYEKGSSFDERTKMFQAQVKKPMPTLSDLHRELVRYHDQDPNDNLKELIHSLKIFTKGGIYDLFDTQSTVDVNLKQVPIVTFDISNLEEDVLRPIGMYISLSWTWEKFVKKNPKMLKRVLVDEAWMFLNKAMKGVEYSAKFLETSARRIRKRTGGLLVSSQSFKEFADSEEGKAVLRNASVNILLKQSMTDIDSVQETFKLSDGEKGFLMKCRKGEMLIKMNDDETSLAYALAFENEREFITRLNSQKD